MVNKTFVRRVANQPLASARNASSVPLNSSWSPGSLPESAYCQMAQVFQLNAQRTRGEIKSAGEFDYMAQGCAAQ